VAELDGYDAYYSSKLWRLIPEVYRIADAQGPGDNGPLREMVDRLGVQVSVIRRGVDRLWEDQSIEACDDWVVPYLAELLGTRIAPGMDARGARVDVAKSIHYRRRKGTVAVLEELATNVTGWEVRVVEFFRQLARTRHNLDPAIGVRVDQLELPRPKAHPPDLPHLTVLPRAEGLLGPRTGTPMGGFAHLRPPLGRVPGAFDETFHTADLRRGGETTGWYDIPRLGVFIWTLRSFGLGPTTPVEYAACHGQYTFDPTGREVQLFAAASRAQGVGLGDTWVSPEQYQLPGPITVPLLEGFAAQLYPASLAVTVDVAGTWTPLEWVTLLEPFPAGPSQRTKVRPELGRFWVSPHGAGDQLRVTYCYALAASIGAGPYDRRPLGLASANVPVPEAFVSEGGGDLQAKLAAVAPSGTVTISDSLTYDSVSAVGSWSQPVTRIVLRSDNGLEGQAARPVVRLKPGATPAQLVITGAPNGSLRIEGIYFCGMSLVLRGDFDTVELACCTFDPGATGATTTYGKAVDGRDLVPTPIWIEGTVKQMTADRCILAPIATRTDTSADLPAERQPARPGHVESLTIRDSILQAIPTGGDATFPGAGLMLDSGQVSLLRTTVVGDARVHRLDASECILHGNFQVADQQNGCVRFSAWTTGSRLPRKYESVEMHGEAGVLLSIDIANPDYMRLRPDADRRTVTGQPSVLTGGPTGSEFGVYAAERAPIRRRAIAFKFDEFMPLGLSPIIVDVT
jgi:hypothetical protein